MESEIWVLCGTAVSLGVVHTALGPDHYLPFIMMGRARQWSVSRTAWITEGHAWINALEDQNLTTHTYEEATAIQVEQRIKKEYFPLLQSL